MSRGWRRVKSRGHAPTAPFLEYRERGSPHSACSAGVKLRVSTSLPENPGKNTRTIFSPLLIFCFARFFFLFSLLFSLSLDNCRFVTFRRRIPLVLSPFFSSSFDTPRDSVSLVFSLGIGYVSYFIRLFI